MTHLQGLNAPHTINMHSAKQEAKPRTKGGGLTPQTLKFTLAHLVPLNSTEQDKSYFPKKSLLIS